MSNKKKLLIVYFSHSGNTRVIASQIHKQTDGDVFEIVTVDPYPADYETVVEQAKQEKKGGFRPKLAVGIDNIDSYDTVFIGYPNWWSTMPMAVFSFLEKYDFSRKTIMPFCTHEGSGMGASVRDLKKICQESQVLDGLAVRGSSVNRAQNDVSAWLMKVGILDNER